MISGEIMAMILLTGAEIMTISMGARVTMRSTEVVATTGSLGTKAMTRFSEKVDKMILWVGREMIVLLEGRDKIASGAMGGLMIMMTRMMVMMSSPVDRAAMRSLAKEETTRSEVVTEVMSCSVEMGRILLITILMTLGLV